tara:strand:- start:15134 stop:17050 length:1917 start_codon:yes stop_codon:yes gene_type:complete
MAFLFIIFFLDSLSNLVYLKTNTKNDEVNIMAIQITSEQIKAQNIITSLLAADAVNASKLDLTDNYTFSGAVGVPTPSADGHATTKAYVDNLIAGLHWKDSCRVATTAALVATYNNGSSGVGATLTANSNGAISIDGVGLQADDRVLVKNQAVSDREQNGIYKVTTVGAVGAPFVLTRTDDADTVAKLNHAAVFIREGSANADAGYTLESDGVSAIGTSDLVWAQFSGAGSITGGNGISKTGNTIAVDLASDPALEFDGGALRVKVDGSTIARDSSGVKIANDGVGTAHIAAAAVTQAKLANNAVGSSQIASNAVTSAKITDANITTAKIADSAVTSAKVANDAITTAKIADDAITSAKIADNAIANAALFDASILAGGLKKNGAGSALEVNADDSSIEINGSGQIAVKANGISNTALAGGITANKLNLSGGLANDGGSLAIASNVAGNGLTLTGQVLSADLDGATLSVGADGLKITDAGVNTAQLTDNAVTTAKITDANVTDAKLASNAVTTAKINAGAVTDAKLANNAVVTAKINNLAVTGAKVADGTLTLGKLAFESRQEKFTGDGSQTNFDLARTSAGLDSVCVYRNGLRMEKAGSPSDADQYSVANSGAGSVGRVTFGVAPDSGDIILVDYLG